MKVYLSIDMEGIAGITEYSEIDPHSEKYPAARRWMTQNVNAAIEGALEAGATDILVNDCHGGGPNMVYDDLHPKARLIKGRLSRPLGNMSQIDRSFDAVLLIGYHARLLQQGIISHTFNYSVGFIDIRINGKSVGEAELAAAVAGTFGVPAVMGSGDDCFCKEMAIWNPTAEAVCVKTALTWQDGIVLSLPEANARIREGAARGIARRKEIPPFTFELPLRLEMECANSAIATTIAFMPGVERVDHRTIAYSASDYLQFYGGLFGMTLLQLTAVVPDSTLPGKY